MIFSANPDATAFLEAAGPILMANEAANNLLIGLALQLRRYPERIRLVNFFGTVSDETGVRAAALMTPPHNLVVFSSAENALPEVMNPLALGLCSKNWRIPGVLGPKEAALAFSNAWGSVAGVKASLRMHERVYELRTVTPPPLTPGALRPAELADLELAAAWLGEFHAEAMPEERMSVEETRETARIKIADENYYLWEDGGQAVALAGRARPTPNGCCIGPVYTPPAFRRRGYAAALTAALSQRQLDAGKQFTVLFTDLANPVSNSIYQKIGYQPVCDFDLLQFG